MKSVNRQFVSPREISQTGGEKFLFLADRLRISANGININYEKVQQLLIACQLIC